MHTFLFPIVERDLVILRKHPNTITSKEWYLLFRHGHLPSCIVDSKEEEGEEEGSVEVLEIDLVAMLHECEAKVRQEREEEQLKQERFKQEQFEQEPVEEQAPFEENPSEAGESQVGINNTAKTPIMFWGAELDNSNFIDPNGLNPEGLEEFVESDEETYEELEKQEKASTFGGQTETPMPTSDAQIFDSDAREE
ncbi:hypothetical protein CB0940_11627 [Cercospora beticola]|uniref:Uncharacterized protein n=1 Tax=Cercospora beticola TaxID=122368 RepID=A0A2G5IDI4_CERBT|nr:hypothetical protein CB0940_11627 [Cercospora beticola]PIB02917.1 hypothetical protein CB0940_11627 [Cercospora beticola]WPB03973.1 hypothetical protein RHO25_008617 [Cercospora beticola]CAK1357241.1 unnamed protein product [Cercospora beticola]